MGNFKPYTQEQIKSIMAERNKPPEPNPLDAKYSQQVGIAYALKQAEQEFKLPLRLWRK